MTSTRPATRGDQDNLASLFGELSCRPALFYCQWDGGVLITFFFHPLPPHRTHLWWRCPLKGGQKPEERSWQSLAETYWQDVLLTSPSLWEEFTVTCKTLLSLCESAVTALSLSPPRLLGQFEAPAAGWAGGCWMLPCEHQNATEKSLRSLRELELLLAL